MKNEKFISQTITSLLVMLCTLTGAKAQQSTQEKTARKILDVTGIEGGLVVHIGCGDGKLTAALRENDSYIVHGLDRNVKNIEKARKHIQGLGLYGKVTVDTFDGRDLPYVDNLVNLLVAEDIGQVPMKECMRVIAPNGVVFVKSGNRWNKTIKPWPDAIDEWTHQLHDAGGMFLVRRSGTV